MIFMRGRLNRINHENCHIKVVKQSRENVELTFACLFLKNTKAPNEIKANALTKGGIVNFGIAPTFAGFLKS